MFKNKISNLIIFTFTAFILFFSSLSLVKADSSLPDNVTITTSPDGSSTTIVVNSKPGFKTSVQTNCVNGKCTHNTTSVAITNADIKKAEDNLKKQQEAMEKFWKAQEELFKQQQKMFDDLFKFSWF